MSDKQPPPKKDKVALETGEEANDIVFGSHSARWYRHAAWFAAECHASGGLPTHIDSPQKAFFLLCKGDELGLPPTAAWDLLYPTKAGRIALTKKGALAVVQAKPTFGSYVERIEGEGTPEMRAVVIATRKGQEPTIVEFSVEDARTAGLLVKPKYRGSNTEYDGPYQSYLKDMLKARAGCRALHVAFAAELAGCLIEGEAEDADAMAERREGGMPKVTVTPSAAEASVGPAAHRLLSPPPPRDPLLEQLRGQRKPEPVAVKADPSAPKDEVTFVNRDGSVAGKITNLGPEPEPDPATRAIIDQQVDETFGAPEQACPRCKAGLNAMGGCDLCGWPGEEDLRQ